MNSTYQTRYIENDIISTLNKYEAHGMRAQPNIIWTSADGHYITDIEGKKYLDFSSGVMITNSGHNNPYIKKAIIDHLETGILTSYMFPNIIKAEFLKNLSRFIPLGYKTALYSTGTESAEAAIKIARTWGNKHKPNSKNLIISYINSFHGRTLGAQSIGGLDDLKSWMPQNIDDNLVIHVPFPEEIYSRNTNFLGFLKALDDKNITPDNISAVVIECYQGCIGSFAPVDYMKKLHKWCNINNVLLVIDEIQSGFGRTGRFWAYEHYNICPDIILAGKGISSSLPLSAVIAKPDVIDLCEPGTLNTTHSGNILCCAAANANLKFIEEHNLVNNAYELGNIFLDTLSSVAEQNPNKVRAVYGKGLVAAFHIGDSIKKVGNSKLAKDFVLKCIANGLMLYYPGGPDGSTVKLAPPLTITKESLIEGCLLIRKVLKTL